MKLTRLSPANALSLAALVTAALALQSQERVGQLATLTYDQREVLRHMSIVYLDDGQGGLAKTIRIEGVNVQVVNGSGAANGNGVGNLLLGYCEEPVDITGSHNLLSGFELDVPTYQCVVVGARHAIESPYSLISGDGHTVGVSSAYASAIGGCDNEIFASAPFAVVVGGRDNSARAYGSSIVGGVANEIVNGSSNASIFGGFTNRIDQSHSDIFGGLKNSISGGSGEQFSAILGGEGNSCVGRALAVVGGKFNSASGSHGTVSGGMNNVASGDFASAAGGRYNTASGLHSAVSGGLNRTASGNDDWVAGSLFEDN